MSVASYQLAIIEMVKYGGRYDAGMSLNEEKEKRTPLLNSLNSSFYTYSVHH